MRIQLFRFLRMMLKLRLEILFVQLIIMIFWGCLHLNRIIRDLARSPEYRAIAIPLPLFSSGRLIDLGLFLSPGRIVFLDDMRFLIFFLAEILLIKRLLLTHWNLHGRSITLIVTAVQENFFLLPDRRVIRRSGRWSLFSIVLVRNEVSLCGEHFERL